MNTKLYIGPYIVGRFIYETKQVEFDGCASCQYELRSRLSTYCSTCGEKLGLYFKEKICRSSITPLLEGSGLEEVSPIGDREFFILKPKYVYNYGAVYTSVADHSDELYGYVINSEAIDADTTSFKEKFATVDHLLTINGYQCETKYGVVNWRYE